MKIWANFSCCFAVCVHVFAGRVIKFSLVFLALHSITEGFQRRVSAGVHGAGSDDALVLDAVLGQALAELNIAAVRVLLRWALRSYAFREQVPATVVMTLLKHVLLQHIFVMSLPEYMLNTVVACVQPPGFYLSTAAEWAAARDAERVPPYRTILQDAVKMHASEQRLTLVFKALTEFMDGTPTHLWHKRHMDEAVVAAYLTGAEAGNTAAFQVLGKLWPRVAPPALAVPIALVCGHTALGDLLRATTPLCGKAFAHLLPVALERLLHTPGDAMENYIRAGTSAATGAKDFDDAMCRLGGAICSGLVRTPVVAAESFAEAASAKLEVLLKLDSICSTLYAEDSSVLECLRCKAQTEKAAVAVYAGISPMC